MSSSKCRLCALGVIVLLMLSIASVALATPITPYSLFGCHFWDGQDDLGTAFTDRCSCNPVNNYLAARVKIQYRVGNEYKETGWSSWAADEDVETMYVRRTAGVGTYCNYIQGEHKAQCGSGNRVELNSEKPR